MEEIAKFKLVSEDSKFNAKEVARMTRELVDEMVDQGFTVDEALTFIAQLAVAGTRK